MADSKGRILVVDPELAGANELSELLESLGSQVVTARSSDEGLRRFWEVLPDLAFVDILRLGDGGERMCRELKRTDYGVITPIAVHSHRHPTLSRVEVMRTYGAVDYLVKPVQEAKVRALIDWVLASRGDTSQPIAHELLDRFELSSDSEGVVSLESGSLPYLLGRAEEEKLSGLLLLTSGSHKNALAFEQGLIVGASSNAPVEQLERVLLSMRKLTPAQLADVKGRAEDGSDLFPLLSFLGILRGEERKEVLRYQALTIGVSMFRVMTGLLQFRRGESIDSPRLDPGIRPTTLALIGLRKNPALLRTATERFVRDPVVFMQPSASSRAASRTLPLTKFERTVLSSVDGERSVKELRELGRLAQIDLDEPLAVLVGSGILKPSSAQPAGTGSQRLELPTEPVPSQPASGSLEKRPFLEVVGSLLRDRATGMLMIEAAASRSFAFLDREIVYARSSRPEDSLGRLLLSERVISREALDRALAVQRQVPERRLGSLLVEMHELTPDALYTGLRSQIIRIFEDTFSWHFGKFNFVPSEMPPEWIVRLDRDPVALLRHGTARMTHQQLRGRWDARARLVSDGHGPDTSVLTNPERELLVAASGDGGVPLSMGDIGRLRRAHLLVSAGYARVAEDGVLERSEEAGEERQTGDVNPGETGAEDEAAPRTVPGHAATPRAARGPDEDGRSGEFRFEIVSSADPAGRHEVTGDPTGALVALIRDELVVEKRALDARLRWAEAELRQAMEELGRLRERTRHLEAENETLRRRPGRAAAPAARRRIAAATGTEAPVVAMPLPGAERTLPDPSPGPAGAQPERGGPRSAKRKERSSRKRPAAEPPPRIRAVKEASDPPHPGVPANDGWTSESLDETGVSAPSGKLAELDHVERPASGDRTSTSDGPEGSGQDRIAAANRSRG